MISTQYGNEVEILRKADEDNYVCRRVCDGAERTYHISQLRADGGYTEIEEAAARRLLRS